MVIFVFGSNLKGIHRKGAALFARDFHGAIEGQGEGLQGSSYALPTCAAPGEPLSLKAIQINVDRFLKFAEEKQGWRNAGFGLSFQVSRVGCGLAGYKDHEIAPMFLNAPDNVWLPSAWARALYHFYRL